MLDATRCGRGALPLGILLGKSRTRGVYTPGRAGNLRLVNGLGVNSSLTLAGGNF